MMGNRRALTIIGSHDRCARARGQRYGLDQLGQDAVPSDIAVDQTLMPRAYGNTRGIHG